MKNTKEIQVACLIDDIYKKKKIDTQKYYHYMTKREGLSSKKIERITNCGGFIQFKSNIDFSKKKVFRANFCKERGCPFCDWRKSIRNGELLSTMAQAITDDFDYRFIFGTLSSINCKGKDITSELDKYNRAYRNLMRRKEIKKISHGSIRKIEITYNKKRDDYNLHIHFLISVNKSYFKSRDYLKVSKWLELWQDCMDDKTIENIYIKKAENKNDSSAYLELAKYSAKSTDLLNNGFEVFDALMSALKGRQLLTYDGVFKKYRKKYNDGELSKYLDTDITEYVWLITSIWNFKKQDYLSSVEFFDFEKYDKQEKETKEIRRRMKPFLSIYPK